jgi:hypothetical protein
MDTAIEAPGDGVVDVVGRLVQTWTDSCNDFLRWQSEEVLEKEPSRTTLAIHRQNLKTMLHYGRVLYADVGDPDSVLNRFASKVSGKLGQLEKSSQMVQNSMPAEEADKLLAEIFPDASGPRKAA